MTTPQVWVSSPSAQIEYDGQSPGEHWELVGTINANQERDFYTYIQILLGLRQTTRGRPEFYLDGDPGQQLGSSQATKTVLDRNRPLGRDAPAHTRCSTHLLREQRASRCHPTDSASTRIPSRPRRQTGQGSDSPEANGRHSIRKMGEDGRLTGVHDRPPPRRLSRGILEVLDATAWSALTRIGLFCRLVWDGSRRRSIRLWQARFRSGVAIRLSMARWS